MSHEERTSGGAAFGTAGLMLLACFIAVGVALFWLRGGVGGKATPAHATAPGAGTSERHLSVGTIARLQCRYEHPVWVVIDAEAWRALWRAHGARDARAVDTVLRSGRAFVAEEDTEAQILGEGVEFYRVRILEGAYQGRTGWVPAYNIAAAGLEREL